MMNKILWCVCVSASLAVEISSYVLLASLSASPLSTTDLGYASRIVRWLDTVVALQALALYSTRVYSREGYSTVTVQSPSGAQHIFEVNQNNKRLYQERALQDTEGKYIVEGQCRWRSTTTSLLLLTAQSSVSR
ncbi:pregnancy zone protein-like [Salvelinus namaycush]|uniref:Pregnancy zone protein-like n=1 Tax=Salvelinus namaycush TaxID=8040 RepID=A0A8U0TIJ9_SALNM|nr:pregnancy zone protein-like [Salvelinus namaycush]XP_038817322.1 pregnancy zone protein-like [Salvelinus namaycush]XP_038817323.1 pregnancy zone protein-like [Salvelinus namaycush]XP_038817324.1 pregnancy zone protein-like [Salvelinus namaycush]XP_038817325.1 pregnancy zone protein-like [Salvelinus namaycush]